VYVFIQPMFNHLKLLLLLLLSSSSSSFSKHPPNNPLALCRMPSLWEVFLSVKDAKIRFTVIITLKSIVKNSPVLQEMLKMLPSWPDALRRCLLSGVFPRKLLNTHWECLFVLPECVYLFYELCLLNFPENKKSYKVLNQGKRAKDFIVLAVSDVTARLESAALLNSICF